MRRLRTVHTGLDPQRATLSQQYEGRGASRRTDFDNSTVLFFASQQVHGTNFLQMILFAPELARLIFFMFHLFHRREKMCCHNSTGTRNDILSWRRGRRSSPSGPGPNRLARDRPRRGQARMEHTRGRQVAGSGWRDGGSEPDREALHDAAAALAALDAAARDSRREAASPARAPKPVGVAATPGCQPKMERRPARSCFVRQGRKQQASGRLQARTAYALEQPTPRTAPVRQASGPLSRGVSFGCPRSPASDRVSWRNGPTGAPASIRDGTARGCRDRACGRTDRARSALVAGRPGPGDQDGAFSGRSRASGS
jgi:hypothetical protein